MKIYKVKTKRSQENQVVTSDCKESVREHFDEPVEIENFGPYISQSSYRVVRSDILE